MKYIVGYPIKASGDFVDLIIANRDKIKEVYFSFADMPSGRAQGGLDEPTHVALLRQMSDLKRISDAGISLNLLFLWFIMK